MEIIWRGVLKIVLGFPLAYMKRAFQNVFPPLFPAFFWKSGFFPLLSQDTMFNFFQAKSDVKIGIY